MRFLIVPAQQMVCIDNAFATPIESSLPSNIALVLWDNGKGFIERNDAAAIRENFSNPAPYKSYIDAAITIFADADPPISLTHAKSIKSDLVNDLFNAKRQAPITIDFGGGETHTWDATDAAVAAMTAALTPWICASINAGDPIETTFPVMPFGSTTPYALTSGGMNFIFAGITARREQLAQIRANKLAAISAIYYMSGVIAFDTTTGALAARIDTPRGPHGLCVYPQPGRYSLGHTGNYR